MNRASLITKWAIGIALAVVLVVFPLSSSPYFNNQLSLTAAYAVALLGLSIVTGHAGQISLAQAAFFGIGAYAAAGFSNLGLPAVVAFVLAALLPGVIGLIVAIPVVRLHGHALALITLALSLIAVPLATRLTPLTGGPTGLRTSLGDVPEGLGLARDQWGYYVTIAVAAVLFLVARNMVTGKMGRALALVRTNEVVGTAMGVPVRRYKIMAFAISAAFGGAGGFLFAFSTQYVSPDTLGFLLGITMLATLVIGGMRSLAGPVIGALFYVYVPDLAGSVSPEQASLAYGLLVVLAILFLPGGIASLARMVPALVRRLRGRREDTQTRPSPATPAHTHDGEQR